MLSIDCCLDDCRVVIAAAFKGDKSFDYMFRLIIEGSLFFWFVTVEFTERLLISLFKVVLDITLFRRLLWSAIYTFFWDKEIVD